MNTHHALYPDLAGFEIDQRLRTAAAVRRRRQVRALAGPRPRWSHLRNGGTE